MRLSQLISSLPQKIIRAGADLDITGLAFDSRRVQTGNLFVACLGAGANGHAFIPQAVEFGAGAVVGESEIANIGIPYIQVPDSRQALGLLAAAWNGFPSRKMVLIGVTGTDGKTTTVNLIYRMLLAAGLQAGMVSTVSAVFGGMEIDTGYHVTTPDALVIQEILSTMAAAGTTHCVLEVTSHGLAQHRVTGCEFDIAALTNITHEHLDYHGSFDTYREAKTMLFSGLGANPAKQVFSHKLAILNADDPACEGIRERTQATVITYGIRLPADVTATNVHTQAEGISFTLRIGGAVLDIQSGLLGEYNVSNILAAATVAIGGLRIPSEVVARAVANLTGIPGRMERIHLGQGFSALVDFAHTPNALRRALSAARTLAGGRVIAVFGSAGLRDREKRRRMAELATDLADAAIFTAEDPRTESLEDILQEMAEGAESKGGLEGVNFWRLPDRGEAIRFAVRMAHPGDVVIACGKGHEQSMCFGETEYPWDDRQAMRAAVAERLGIPGPPMPKLPTMSPSNT